MKAKKNKPKVINIVLIIVAVLTVAFTIAILWLFDRHESIPDTLVTMFFTTIVGELLVSGFIRMTKSKYKDEEVKDGFTDIDEDN